MALDPQTLQSKITELASFLKNPIHDDDGDDVISPPDSDKLLRDFVVDIEAKANQIVTEHAADVTNFNDEDIDAYMDRLKAELKVTEAETASIDQEIESLVKSHVEGTCQLERNLETLQHIVDYAESKGYRQSDTREQAGKHSESEDYQKLADATYESFEISKLKHQIEINELTLKSIQDIDFQLKRVEAIEKIKEALTGLKVVDVEGDFIRVSLTTCIPSGTELTSTKPSEVKHDLLVEVLNGTMEIKNAEIFPNDVDVGEIVEAANAFCKLFRGLPETRCTLGWFLQKVQDKIVMLHS